MREAGQALNARKAVNARVKGMEVREGELALRVKNRAPRFGIQKQLRSAGWAIRSFAWRSPRFGIQMQLRYRLRNESKWWKGTTENISRTGVLFRGEEFAPPNTPLEMRLVLPGGIVGLQSAEVVCKGVVVRAGRPKDARAYPALASTISHYRMIPP